MNPNSPACHLCLPACLPSHFLDSLFCLGRGGSPDQSGLSPTPHCVTPVPLTLPCPHRVYTHTHLPPLPTPAFLPSQTQAHPHLLGGIYICGEGSCPAAPAWRQRLNQQQNKQGEICKPCFHACGEEGGGHVACPLSYSGKQAPPPPTHTSTLSRECRSQPQPD